LLIRDQLRCLVIDIEHYINRMLTLLVKKQAKQEWKILLTIAQNNGFPLQIIHNLKKKLTVNIQKPPTPITQQNKKMGNILVSQATNMKSNLSLQTH